MSIEHPARRVWCRCTYAAAATLAMACLDRPVGPASPTVTARFSEVTNQSVVSKIDLLFMIDNSASMADKQKLLADVISDLVNRLVNPICLKADGSPSAFRVGSNGRCPPPTQRDFAAVRDIHVGIITSSLGGHGAPGVCDGANDNADVHNADMSHLVARSGGTKLPTFQDMGFLNWNPSLAGAYSDAMKLREDFRTMVTGVGQHGCGYEAQLEAVYRFLVDPAPYKTITLVGGMAVPSGVDEVVLKERADFLRPDSLVAIIAVTDENDYSFVDGHIGWAAAASIGDRPFLKGGASACQTNPNDRCCVNCGDSDVPGCTPHANDPACATPLTAETDPVDLRASRSKQQYGFDFAWPVDRYVEGFTRPTLDRFGAGAKNPLFNDVSCKGEAGCAPERPANLVFFAGIVGVPWQDIARDPNDLTKGFQNAKELVERQTWSVVLGDPAASPPVPPTDPHMIVSSAPRPGIAGPNSAFGADPKNGHEWLVSPSGAGGDLQYACTFPLAEPRDCAPTSSDCDCRNGDVSKSSLCQDPSGAYGNRQFAAKGYPGLRELELLKALGDQGIVGSICPKNTTESTSLDYGYAPAIAALIERLRVALRDQCLPRTLAAADDGYVPCAILEVFDPPDGTKCECEDDPNFPGRVTPSPDVRAANPNLDRYGSCACQIEELTGAQRTSCLKDRAPSSDINGWCYVDPGQSRDTAQCELVSNCPSTSRRIIRYVGEQPRGANIIVCQEQAFTLGTNPGKSVCP